MSMKRIGKLELHPNEWDCMVVSWRNEPSIAIYISPTSKYSIHDTRDELIRAVGFLTSEIGDVP